MLSDDKVMHMSHVILKDLMDRDILDIIEEEGTVRHAIRRAINIQLKIGMEIDETVRKKLTSLSRGVVEGSPEWETLYQKYFAEEEVKKGMKRD